MSLEHIKRLFPLIILLLGCSGIVQLKGPLPNILLIVMDTARADHYSCYEYHRPTTPNLDRVAARGLRFTQAISTSAWTLPSHATLFTGMLPLEHGACHQHCWLSNRFPTLAELLRMRGYQTAGFTNNGIIDKAKNLDRGFDVFYAIWADTSAVLENKHSNTEHTNRLVRDYLTECEKDKPFFIFINYMDTHRPYLPPEPFKSKFLPVGYEVDARLASACGKSDSLNLGKFVPNQKDLEGMVAVYDGALNYLDFRIGELLDFLESRNLLDNTLVIITSDHGELLGEYGRYGHGALLNRQLVHIPLILAHPTLIPEPGVREAPVGIADIFHTIVELLDLEGAAPTRGPIRNLFDPHIGEFPCYSLLKVGRLFEGQNRYMRDTHSLWTDGGKRHLIACDEILYEYYNPQMDFEEQNNLCPSMISEEELIEEISAFEDGLIKFVESPEDLRLIREVTVDPQQERVLRALGYIGDEKQPLLAGISEPGEEFHPHVKDHVKTAVFFYRHDSLDLAEKHIRLANIMDPGRLKIEKNLAILLFKKKEYEEAIQLLKRILHRDESNEEMRVLLGKSLFYFGRKDEALKFFQEWVERDPENLDAALSCAAFLMEKGDFEGARQYIFQISKYHTNSLQALQRLVKLCIKYENYPMARELLIVELRETPSSMAMTLLGRVCLEMGRVEEGRGYLEKALEFEDLSPEIRAAIERHLAASQ